MIQISNLKKMSCKFLNWFVDNENDCVYNELLSISGSELVDATSTLYDIWVTKYYRPDTITN